MRRVLVMMLAVATVACGSSGDALAEGCTLYADAAADEVTAAEAAELVAWAEAHETELAEVVNDDGFDHGGAILGRFRYLEQQVERSQPGYADEYLAQMGDSMSDGDLADLEDQLTPDALDASITDAHAQLGDLCA